MKTLIAILIMVLSTTANAARITDQQGRTKAYVTNGVVRAPTGQAIVRINNGVVRAPTGKQLLTIK